MHVRFRKPVPRNPRWIGRHTKGTTSSNSADVWFLRLAHVSQFGLFVLTIGAFYFTVLPLYQKALLEEAIAKKEVELKEITKTLEQTYRSARAGAVNQFVLGVGLGCSGLMLPSRNLFLLGKTDIPNRKPRAQEVLEIDPQSCLIAAAAKYSPLRDLRPDDAKMFQDAMASVARDLEERRVSLIAQSRSSWNSSSAKENAEAYGKFVRSRILSLKDISWKQ